MATPNIVPRANEEGNIGTTTKKWLSVRAKTMFVNGTEIVPSDIPIVVSVSDETTLLTTGTAKVKFRMPHVFKLTGVRASVSTAPTGSALTVDINENGSSVLSTKLTIDAGELTSTTAATAAVISDTLLADDAEITIDIDNVGSTVAGKGLKVTLLGARSSS